jgi:hypothetical protein
MLFLGRRRTSPVRPRTPQPGSADRPEVESNEVPPARLRSRLDELGRKFGDEQNRLAQMLWRQVKALVRAARGEHAQGLQLARGGRYRRSNRRIQHAGDALCDLAAVLQSAGRTADATAAFEQALERYERERRNWRS